MYHVDDLKKFVSCPRSYFYSREQYFTFNNFLRSDESIENLLARYLGVENYYLGIANDSNERFFKEKGNYLWFIKTRFEAFDLRIKIPLMHKNKNAYDIYFVHRGTSLKNLDLFYYRVNLEVLKFLNIKIDNLYIAYINSDYIYHKTLDLNKLFIISDTYEDKKLLDLFNEEEVDYKKIIKEIKASNLNTYNIKKRSICHSHPICPYYHICHKDDDDLPDNSILTLVSSENKEVMYENGIKKLIDVSLDMLEGQRVQYAQILADKNGGRYVSKYALKNWLKDLEQRPITFIDFEWDAYLIPKYEKMRPLGVLPFEFVLYILDEKGELNHYSFVGKGDCRKEFVEALIKYLPKSGPILAYNAYGAECYRIKELANYYDKYKKELLKINSRFKDLATPFQEGLIYDTKMRGNFSLKKLIEIVSNYNYKQLIINDGLKAVYNWRDFDKGKEDTDDKKIIKDLIEYCSLDAYGLYLVYMWLIKQV